MTYTLIGTGNMAYFLATRLQQAGWLCKGVWGRTPTEAEKLARQINTRVLASLNDISDEQDVCLIAVADHAIEEISAQLILQNTTVIHTAGAVALSAIKQENKAVLWPVYSILKNNLPQEKNIPLIGEASNPFAEEKLRKIAQVISTHLTIATHAQRQWMHLIAAFTNNFPNHLIAISEILCREQQIDPKIFHPILQQTFDRLQTGNAYSLQTGAARRKDETTLQKHVSLLTAYPLWQELYKMLSASIKDLYSDKDK